MAAKPLHSEKMLPKCLSCQKNHLSLCGNKSKQMKIHKQDVAKIQNKIEKPNLLVTLIPKMVRFRPYCCKNGDF